MYDLYSIGSIDGIHLILICRTVQRGMVIARTAAYRLKVKKKSKVCRRTFWVDYVFVWQVVEDSNVFQGGKTQLEGIAPFSDWIAGTGDVVFYRLVCPLLAESFPLLGTSWPARCMCRMGDRHC